jgi:hypothetical protein
MSFIELEAFLVLLEATFLARLSGVDCGLFVDGDRFPKDV